MAYANPGAWYVNYGNGSSTGYYGVTAWASGTPVAGQLCRQATTPAVGSERVFVCIIAGVDAVEPVWTVTKGAKNVGGSATWQECTGEPGVNGDISANCPVWTVSSTPPLGRIIYHSGTASLQICSTSGAGGVGGTPAFSATAGVTTADASATWTSLGLASGFAGWAAPHARLVSALTANWAGQGNVVFVGDNHAETQASSMTIPTGITGTQAAPGYIYCVDHTAAVPPGTANLKTTATISITGANSMYIAASSGTGGMYVYGITFQTGSTTNGYVIYVGYNTASSQLIILDTCGLALLGTGAGQIYIGSGGATATSSQGTKVILNNTTMRFSGASQYLSVGCEFLWRNTASALLGTAPTTLFVYTLTVLGNTTFEGVDLGSFSGTLQTSNTTSAVRIALIDCKIGSSMSLGTPGNPAVTIDMVRSDSSGTDYRLARAWSTGTLTQSTSVVRTGGASDGVTPISFQVVTVASSTWVYPFECFPISIWNAVTGTNRNVDLFGIWNSASLPNNDQVWHDVEYLGASGSPLASLGSGTKANNLATGSAWTADTSAWDSQASAWISNHVYSAGAIISGTSVSNAGRLFYCTVGGTSTNGAAPAGFASAVDGGTVTDNTVTWRAMVRFRMRVTLSSPQPQLVGYLRSYVKAATASTTFYVDPLLVLS